MSKKHQCFALAILFIFSTDLYALSCGPKKDRIIASCHHGKCTNAFYVTEIIGYTSCGRLSILNPLPTWGIEALEHELSNESELSEDGIYELVLSSRYWQDKVEIPDFESYLRQKLNKGENYYIYRSLSRIEDTDISQLKNQWASTEQFDYILNILWMLFDWGSSIAGSVLLIYSVKLFHNWLFRNARHNTLIRFALLQTGVLLVSLIFFIFPIVFFISLLPVLVILIWVYEITLFLAFKIKETVFIK